MTVERIYLSPPDTTDAERELLLDAFDSNWIAPLGPHVDAFERELADSVGVADAAALSSGTAALHLGLLLVGVKPGDEVIVPTLTFVATANAALYIGAEPVFVDSDPTSWNVDARLVAAELEPGPERSAAGVRCAQAVVAEPDAGAIKRQLAARKSRVHVSAKSEREDDRSADPSRGRPGKLESLLEPERAVGPGLGHVSVRVIDAATHEARYRCDHRPEIRGGPV